MLLWHTGCSRFEEVSSSAAVVCSALANPLRHNKDGLCKARVMSLADLTFVSGLEHVSKVGQISEHSTDFG